MDAAPQFLYHFTLPLIYLKLVCFFFPSSDCEKIYSRIETVYWNLKYFIKLKHSILIPLPINHIYVKIHQELAFTH